MGQSEPVKVVDGPLGVDDYAIDREDATKIATLSADALSDWADDLDYYWNMHGQEDERERALLNAISDRLKELAPPLPPVDAHWSESELAAIRARLTPRDTP